VSEPPVAATPLPIFTPDRRVRVFISGAMTELSAERLAARRAVSQLHLTPVMFEEGARPHAPREIYESYLAQSDVFVGIYWQSYGFAASSSDTSGLEDEYLLSVGTPRLLYVKAATEREPRLQELLSRLESDELASYKRFDTPEALTALLADDLAVLLTERFTGAGAGDEEPDAVLPASPTEIIGRESELIRVTALLRDESVHLVTLLGPGGIGKTRLALEVARRLQDTRQFDAVFFVDLAPVTDVADWAHTVASAVGILPAGTVSLIDIIIDRLQERRTLLVLDNFEHMLAAVPELGRLLAGCPGLSVLATSRIVLQLRGEREVMLSPLETPSATGPADLATIQQSPAVQLLLARARDVRRGFAMTEANSEAMAELSRRLDGIPLALELVAAQFRLLPPAALARRLREQLSRPLDLTAGTVDLPSRQRTLRATIDWSYGLLSEAEKTLLARVSVLSPPWTLSVAEAVGTVDDDLDVVVTMTSLVSQSLVRTADSEIEEPTFRLLDTIRSYAGEKLAEREEYDDTMARLSGQLLGFVAGVSPILEGPDNEAVGRQVDRRIGDLRAVTAWAMARDDANTVIELSAPLFSYWWSRGLLPYTHPIAERSAALPSAARLSPDTATLLLWERGMAHISIGQNTQAEPLFQQMVAATRQVGGRLHGHALFGLGASLIRSRPVQAAAILDQAADAFRSAGQDWGLALTLSTRGGLALIDGDPATATSMHLEGLAAAERADNDHLRAQVLDMLGLDAAAVGAVELARARYVSAAALHTRLLDQEGSAYGLSGLAGLALSQGRPEVAAKLLGASTRALDTVGLALWPGMLSSVGALKQAVQEAMEPADFARASAEGSQLRITEAFRYGLIAVPDSATASGEAGSAANVVARNP
jgi:predicted ATPase